MEAVRALSASVLAVDHVGVAVADLDEAISFYTDVLGFRVVHRETNSDQGVAEVMLAPSGDRPGAAQVQLMSPLADDSPLWRFLDRHGPGLQQVAYRVADLDDVCINLRDRGIRLLYDSARPGTRGSRINFVHPKDAGGVLIELVEPATEPTSCGDDPGGSSDRAPAALHQEKDQP